MAREAQKTKTKKTRIREERERAQQQRLLIGVIIVAILVVGTIGYGLLDQFVLLPRKAVARVEDQKISVGQFQDRVRYNRWQNIQEYYNTLQTIQMFGNDETFSEYLNNSLDQITSQLDNPTAMGENALEQLIKETIIQLEADKRGITVSEQEVQEDLQAAFGYYPDGSPTPTITPTIASTSTLSPLQLSLVTITPTPTQTVEPVADISAEDIASVEIDLPEEEVDAPITEAESETPPTLEPSATPTEYTQEGYQTRLDDFLTQIAEINFEIKDVEHLVKQQILLDKVRDAVTADMKPEEEQVWARHILVTDESTVQEVLGKLENGEDWTDLAAEYSEDTSNKDKGGDLGWFGSGQMVAEFEEAAFSLEEIGDISEPIETDFGFHIIQLLGKETRPLSASAFSSKKEQFFNDWLEEASTSDTVERFDLWQNLIPTEPTIPPVMPVTQ